MIDKPIKPGKKVEATGSATYYFDHISNKVSLLGFLDWLRENIPEGSFDVTISLDEEIDEYNGDVMGCNILIQWKYLVKNTRYKSQMKKYEKQLAKWKKQNDKKRKDGSGLPGDRLLIS